MHATTPDNLIALPTSRVHPSYAGMSQRELASALAARVQRLDMAQLASLSWMLDAVSACVGSEPARLGTAPSR